TLKLNHWWSAGTHEQQAEDINSMFANESVKAIIAHTGGFSAMSVVDLLDFDLIEKNPKPFMGMSDNTIYQWAMFTKCNLVGFHCNDLTFGFGQRYIESSEHTRQYLKQIYIQILTSTQPIGVINPQSQWECWREGKAKGMLLGGNLKRFMMLPGTEYFPPLSIFDNAILFWEEIGETYYDISICLYKMKTLGILDRISGMIIGQPVWINTYFDEVNHPALKEVVLDAVSEFQFPILAQVDFGHHISMIPMPIGIQAQIDAKNLQFMILDAALI
ncbi:MAG: S66 peptidase family protein, partial [Aggregatilineales bacterium]